MRVIDISEHQGQPDFAAVRASGVEGVILKVSEGATYIDGQYAVNVGRARGVGLKLGHYHYARPENNSARLEFEHFAGLAQAGTRDWIVLDAESSGGNTAWVTDWLGRAAVHYNRRPVFYSYAGWIAGHLDPAQTIDAWLWLAAYQSTPPTAPRPWSGWAAWQFTSSGSVPGIGGRVDINDWRVPEEDTVTEAEIEAIAARVVAKLSYGSTVHTNLGDVVNSVDQKIKDAFAAHAPGAVDTDAIATAVANKLAARLAS